MAKYTQKELEEMMKQRKRQDNTELSSVESNAPAYAPTNNAASSIDAGRVGETSSNNIIPKNKIKKYLNKLSDEQRQTLLAKPENYYADQAPTPEKLATIENNVKKLQEDYKAMKQRQAHQEQRQAYEDSSFINKAKNWKEGLSYKAEDATKATEERMKAQQKEEKQITSEREALSDEQKALIDEYSKYKKDYTGVAIGGDPKVMQEFATGIRNAKEKLLASGLTEEEIERQYRLSSRQQNKAETEQFIADTKEGVKNGNWASNIAQNALTVLSSPAEAMAGAEDALANKFGYAADTNDVFHRLQKGNAAVREQTSANILGDNPTKGREILNTLYQGGMSAADNLYLAGGLGAAFEGLGLGEKAVKALTETSILADYALKSYSASADKMQNMPVENQAKTALAGATIETATEIVSTGLIVDALFSKSPQVALTKLLLNVALNGVAEGSEEVASQIANTAADIMINGDYSDYKQNVMQYGEEQANEIFKGEVWESFKLGTVAGIMGGAAANTVRIGVNAIEAKELLADGNYKDIAEGLDTEKESYSTDNGLKAAQMAQEKANELATKQENGEKVSIEQKRQLKELLDIAMDDAAKTETARLEKESETVELPEDLRAETVNDDEAVKTFTDAISKVETPADLVRVRQNFEANTQNISDVNRNEIALKLQVKEKSLLDNGAKAEDFEQAKTLPTKEDAYRAGYAGKQFDATEETAEAYSRGKYDRISNDYAKANPETVGKNTVDGKVIDITGVENGVIKTNSGDFSVQDIKFANNDTRAVYETAANMGDNLGNVYANNYVPGVASSVYKSIFDKVKMTARTGSQSFENLLRAKKYFTDYIPETNLRNIYDAAANVTANEKAHAPKKVTKVKRKGEGKVTVAKSIKKDAPVVVTAELLAKKTGIDIVIQDEADYNGKFSPEIATIFINGNSSNPMKALIHELGEVAEAWASDDMRTFKNDLLAWYIDKTNPQELENTIKKYQNAYQKVEDKNFRQAADEYLNDALYELMMSEDGVNDFLQWTINNKSKEEAINIFTALKDFLDKLIARIEEIISSGNAGKIASNMSAEQAKNFRDRLLDILDAAVENANNAEVVEETENKRAFSLYFDDSQLNDYINAGTKHHLRKAKDIKNGKQLLIHNREELEAYVKDAMHNPQAGTLAVVAYGKVTDQMRKDVLDASNNLIELHEGYLMLNGDDIYHAWKNHRNPKYSDNLPMTEDEFIEVIANIDKCLVLKALSPKFDNPNSAKREKVYMGIGAEDGMFEVIEIASRASGGLTLKNIWKLTKEAFENRYGKEKSNIIIQGGISLKEYTNNVPLSRVVDTASNQNIPSSKENGNSGNKENTEKTDSFSLNVDSDGNELSEGQKEYFKDSRVRDDEGNLKVVYHGSYKEFTVFDINKGSINGRVLGDGFYFAPTKEMAQRWNEYGNNVYKCYLNITNPYYASVDEPNPPKVEKFIKDKLGEKYDESSQKLVFGNPWWGLKYTRDEYINHEYDSKYNNTESALRMLYDLSGLDTDNMSNSEYSSAESKSKRETLKSLGYDGIIYKKGEKGFALYGGDQYVAFDANQIKEVDNLNPTISDDIRYSLDIEDDEIPWDDYVIAEDELTKVSQKLKGITVDEDNIKALAEKTVKKYKSSYSADKLAENITKIFTHVQSGERLDMADVEALLSAVAKPVIEGSFVADQTLVQNYKDFRSYVKGLRISLSDAQKAEAASAAGGKYGDFHRAAFGYLNIVSDGTNIDSLWSEIQDKARLYGIRGLDNVTSDTDEVIALVDAMKETRERAYQGEKAYTSKESIDEAAKELALNLVADYVETTEKDIASGLRGKVDDYKKRIANEYEQKYKELKEQYDEETARLKAKNRASYLRGLDNAKKEDYRAAVKKTAGQLFTMLEHPTDKKHIPDALRKPTAEFLDTIDFVSHRSKEGSKEAAKWQDKMNGLSDLLQKIIDSKSDDEHLNGLSIGFDDELVQDMENFVATNGNKALLSKISGEQMKQLNKILTGLRVQINNANALYANKMHESIAEVGQGTMRETKDMKDRLAKNGISDAVKNFFNLDMIDSVTYFEMLGPSAKSIWQELREGFDTKVARIRETQNWFEGTLKELNISDEEVREWASPKNTKVYTFESKIKNENGSIETREVKLKFNPAQVMELWAEMQRPQAVNHILVGGIKADALKGDYNPQLVAAHLTRVQIEQITSELNDKQLALIKKMQGYLSNECSDMGNAVTLKAYGYSKFTEPTYWPIKTDGNSNNATDKTVENAQASMRAIVNVGFTKELKVNANNAIIIRNCFETFTDHVSQMATYEGMALPVMDAMKWFNYKDISLGSGEEGVIKDEYAVRTALDRVLGKKGQAYFTTFMQDVNNSTKAQGSIADTFVSNFKAAAIGANLRVVIQQPTAIVRALNEMDAKYLIAAQASLPQAVKYAKKAQEINSAAQWKAWGYFDSFLGQSMNQVITKQSSVMDKIQDAAAKGAQLGDDLTWGILYKAVELEIKDTTKLKEGSKAFDEAVSKRFSEIIDRTQVVDTVFHRNQMMRSKNAWNKMATAFMMEPSKTYNMLYRALITGDKKKLAKAMMVFILNGIAVSAAAGLIDAIRDDDKDKQYIERWMQAVQENIVDNVNPLNLLPYAKDIFSAIQGYDPSRMDVAWIYDSVKAVQEIGKIRSGDTKKTTYGILKTFTKPFSEVTGIPVSAAMRELVTIYNEFAGYANLDTVTANKPSEKERFKKMLDTSENVSKDVKAEFNSKVETEKAAGLDDKEAKKKVKTAMAKSITDAYKDELISLYNSDKKEAINLKKKLVDAHIAIGYTSKEANDKINKWIE